MCWHPILQLSFLFGLLCLLLAAAAAVSCRLYHTVPQALELSTLWQPRYNSSRTESLCGLLLRVCWHCICVCDVCYKIRKHVACATPAAVLLNVNSTWFLLNTAIFLWVIQQPIMLHVFSNISCDCCYLHVPFQFASPLGFYVTHIPKGNLVYYTNLTCCPDMV